MNEEELEALLQRLAADAFGAGVVAALGDTREAIARLPEHETEAALRRARAAAQRPLDEVLALLPKAPKELKRDLGRGTNELKARLAAAFERQLAEIARRTREADLAGPEVDVTLPGVAPRLGRLHPLRLMAEEAVEAFARLGFDIVEGPEVELYDYNFTKLNFPPDHPATDMQDSFFLPSPDDARVLLRTHTSNMQIREMLRREPPFSVVTTGACFRRDEEDATHLTMFQQIEVFVVGEGVSFAHLRGTLELWLRGMFGEGAELRFRPSFFPFVEPGAEVDIRVPDPKGGVGKFRELGGCGMIHPNVLSACGHDPERWTGFAWGFGIDRIAMSRFAIPDIRMLYENDVRFLHQF